MVETRFERIPNSKIAEPLQSSSEARFKAYLREVRRELMMAVLVNDEARNAVLFYLLESVESREDVNIELSARLGEAVTATIDTLLLRYVMMSFLAALHSNNSDHARRSAFSDDEIELARLLNPFPKSAKYQASSRADFPQADLSQAARSVEGILLAMPATTHSLLIQDFLGLDGSTRYELRGFRYEDLNGTAIQDYYEDSLSTSVHFSYDQSTKTFDIEVVANGRKRKELGAYYTNAPLCRFMVEQTVKRLFGERLEQLEESVAAMDAGHARTSFDALINFSVCDPTLGSAAFLRAAFEYLTESSIYFRLCKYIDRAKVELPFFYKDVIHDYPFLKSHEGAINVDGIGEWEAHVLRRMLYGVDIDSSAVCIASQVFALSSTQYITQSERFPSFFNTNLKIGNALISPTNARDRAEWAHTRRASIAELIRLRLRAQNLRNNEEAYAELAALFQQADQIRTPILNELIDEHVYPILEHFTGELRPFSWELEFPEIFFNEDGSLKDAPGFDVVVGNPPWDAVKYNNNEFSASIGLGNHQPLETMVADNDAVASAYEHYLNSFAAWKKWASSSDQYEFQQGGRDRNKWRMTAEVSWKLTKTGGAMSLVLPSGIISDEGGFALKKWMLREGEAAPFISFEKENNVFSGSQAFTIMTLRKGQPTRHIQHLEGLTQIEQLSHPPYIPEEVPVSLIERISPHALAIPSVRDETDKSILEKLYECPLIGDTSASWHAQFVSYDFHMTHDQAYFDQGGDIPLVEGKNIKPYEIAPLDRIRKRVAFRRQIEPANQYRIACAGIAGTLDPRRVFCTLLPHGYATGNGLNCLLVNGNDAERLVLVGLLNSLVVEWRVRQLARNNNLNKFMLAQLPIPRPPADDLAKLAALVAALVTADTRFSDLRPLLRTVYAETKAEKRHEIRCLIDAEAARLYGLTTLELKRVLGVFDKVPETTKTLICLNFARMEEMK